MPNSSFSGWLVPILIGIASINLATIHYKLDMVAKRQQAQDRQQELVIEALNAQLELSKAQAKLLLGMNTCQQSAWKTGSLN